METSGWLDKGTADCIEKEGWNEGTKEYIQGTKGRLTLR